jgi:hypothetical protein
MPKVYRVTGFEGLGGASWQVTATSHDGLRRVKSLMELAFPGVSCTLPTSGLAALTASQTFQLTNADGLDPDIMKLLTSQTAAVCIIDAADVSECLGWYRLPKATDASPEDWPYTELGSLVYSAKYRGQRAEAETVLRRMAGLIQPHPLLSTAQAIASVPPSGANTGRFDWPAISARSLANWMKVPCVPILRTRSVVPQKNVTNMDERRANQEGSMQVEVNLAAQRTLVVDDLYMGGESMREAVRALRAAGASTVFGLSAAKTVKGSQGCWEI